MEPDPIGLHEQYRFKFSEEAEWRKCLDQQGFVVIAQWLSQDLCDHYVDEFWGIMEHMADGRLDRNNPATQILSKNYPPVLHGGMIQYIGHSQPQWQLRKAAKSLFAKLWHTNDLKSSFDGFCFMNGRRNYQKVPANSFLHTDQSPTRNNIWSYQGVQTLTDSPAEGGGFVVVTGSNHFHRTYFQNKNLLGHKKDWFLVPSEDKAEDPLCHYIKLNTKAGDFILFDSRTFHCNTVPLIPVLRICAYICMIPSDHVSEKTKQLRKLAFKNKRDGFRTFPALPRFIDDRNAFQKLQKGANACQLDEQMQVLI